jgi:hypothetical protein
MAQLHNNQGCCDTDFLDYVPEELIEQSGKSFIPCHSLIAATEGSMWFSAVLPQGGSPIASSSQPIPSSNSNSNSNDITSITDMTSIENTRLVDERTIVEGAMSFGGYECCH